MPAADSFDGLVDELIADQFAANPVLASALGADGHDDRLPDMTATAVASRESADDAWTQRLAGVTDERLSAEQRIDRDLALMVLRGRAIMRDWADWRRNPDHYAGPALTGIFSLLLNRIRPEAELASSVAARLGALPELLDQGIANLDPELASPDLLCRSLGQIAAGAAYARAVAGEFDDGPGRQRVAAAGESCVVAPSAPFTRTMLAVAHYSQPPPFAPVPPEGGRPGHFFVPYPPEGASPEQVAARLATNNRHGAWSIAVHEAYPGHHWHFAWLAANAAAGRARPLRFVLGSTYFVEGWGLYTEELLREQGFFRTPEQELGQQDFRLFRAARIVVDTSLHLGEMTVSEAVDHMTRHTSLSRETAHAEVLRYCAWPTQASSYLTGALEIDRLRRRWLGEGHGSLREFHDRAAGAGRLPLGLVERVLFDAALVETGA